MKRATMTLLCITLAASVAGTPREAAGESGARLIASGSHPQSPRRLVAEPGRSDAQTGHPPPGTSRIGDIVAGEASSFVVAAPALRHGTWAYADPSHGSRYLAIPEGPGWNVTVCGPLGCLDRVSTDAGPELWLQRAGRIGDLAAVMFEEICGPLSRGLCSGSYTITGRADQHPEDPPEHPDDARMRLEDQPLPATSTEDVP